MDFRNYNKSYSDQAQKAQLRKELEQAMQEYKGKITVLPYLKQFDDEFSEVKALRRKAKLAILSTGETTKELSIRFNLSKALLNRIVDNDIRVGKKSLLLVAKKLGLEA